MKRFMILLTLIACVATQITACSNSGDAISAKPSQNFQASSNLQTQASDSLETLKKLINKDNFKQMGFQSLEEVSVATLGEPLQDFMVRQDDLKKYAQGIDPNRMLTDTDLIIYPILVKGETRSSIEGFFQEGKWTATSFGSPNYIKSIMNQLTTLAGQHKVSPSSIFIVRVPALNYVFLGYRADLKLMLAPVFDIPEFEFKSGVVLPAETIFIKLVIPAQNRPNLPG